MGTNLIIFSTCAGLMGLLLSEALSIYLVKEKGRPGWEGIVLGLVPLLGHIVAAFLKTTDTFLVTEMYQRELITRAAYNHTMIMQRKKK